METITKKITIVMFAVMGWCNVSNAQWKKLRNLTPHLINQFNILATKDTTIFAGPYYLFKSR